MWNFGEGNNLKKIINKMSKSSNFVDKRIIGLLSVMGVKEQYKKINLAKSISLGKK